MRRAVIALLALTACSTGNALPKLPAQSTGALGHYELAAGVRTTVHEAMAYRFDQATLDEAKRLARAFGVTAPPKLDEDGWSFGPYGKTVEGVQPPSAYVASNGRFKVLNDRGVAHTGVGPPPHGLMNPPIVRPKNYTLTEAKALAGRAIRSAGAAMSDPILTVPYSDGYSVSVEVIGRVGHVRADGYESRVYIDQDKTITDADGIVTAPHSVGRCGLASLARAVERLNDGFGVDTCLPRALRGLPGTISCGMQPAGRPDAVTTLTAVEVGLMMTYDSETAWLIPAYFFTTSDGQVVVTPAAAEHYFGTKTR